MNQRRERGSAAGARCYADTEPPPGESSRLWLRLGLAYRLHHGKRETG
ncbi:MAG TPA: hypothetical protein VHJ77_00285 [Vicinamibacterales bacterium]|nr:hypothetical protein [Vicinamibacterales bacterium]